MFEGKGESHERQQRAGCVPAMQMQRETHDGDVGAGVAEVKDAR